MRSEGGRNAARENNDDEHAVRKAKREIIPELGGRHLPTGVASLSKDGRQQLPLSSRSLFEPATGPPRRGCPTLPVSRPRVRRRDGCGRGAEGDRYRELLRRRSLRGGAGPCARRARRSRLPDIASAERLRRSARRAKKSVDVVWIGLSLHHLRAPAKLEVMRAAHRLLDGHGMLLVYENASPDGEDRDTWLERWDRQEPDWTALTADEWRRMAAHVRAHDFPETVSRWRELGREAGFGTSAGTLCRADEPVSPVLLSAVAEPRLRPGRRVLGERRGEAIRASGRSAPQSACRRASSPRRSRRARSRAGGR